MAAPRDIGCEHPDLAVGDLARRAGVLPSHAAGGLALLQKTGLVNHQNGVIRRRCSSAYSRTISRNASASQRPRPRIACCRQGPGSPAASARIQPVLRRSSPRSPSRNRPADAATRSCVNKGRIRAFTSRSDAPHSSSVSSIDTPLIHPLPTTREKVRAPPQNRNCSVSLLPRSHDPLLSTVIPTTKRRDPRLNLNG